MCAKCFHAVTLMQHNGLSESDAMAALWNLTAFPFADGRTVLRQTKEWLYARGRKRAASPRPTDKP